MSSLLKKSAWALLIILIAIPPLWLGGNVLYALIGLVAMGAAYEIAQLDHNPYFWINWIINLIFILLIGYTPSQFFILELGGLLLLQFVLALVIEDYGLERTVYQFSLVSLVGLGLQGLASLYQSPGHFGARMMLFVVLACYLCDSFAYICGFFFGKHKLNPRVSPKKTWEGAIGGFLFGLVGSYLYGLSFLKEVDAGWLLLTAFVLPIVAQIGDLSFSLVKRHFEIKDFSQLIPYHGGILDRIDSLLFCLMVVNGLRVLGGFLL